MKAVSGLRQLGENREHVSEAAVGDPHLLTVEDVVRAIALRVALVRAASASEPGPVPSAHRRRSSHRWRAGAGNAPSDRRAEIDDRQRADGGVRPKREPAMRA